MMRSTELRVDPVPKGAEETVGDRRLTEDPVEEVPGEVPLSFSSSVTTSHAGRWIRSSVSLLFDG
jgi:hypothetical protein